MISPKQVVIHNASTALSHLKDRLRILNTACEVHNRTASLSQVNRSPVHMVLFNVREGKKALPNMRETLYSHDK